MNAIDLVALLSFAILVVAWAILPSSVRRTEEVVEERTSMTLAPES